MGATYGNITLKGASQSEVARCLDGRDAAVSHQIGDYLVVFDWSCDDLDTAAIQELVFDLTRDLGCSAFTVLVHDDNVLAYMCDREGEYVDSYNSAPSYCDHSSTQSSPPRGGDVGELCSVFPCSDQESLRSILHERQYVFETERHKDLVDALGLPSFSVGTSLATLKRREVIIGLPSEKIIWPNDSPSDNDIQLDDKQFFGWLGAEDKLKPCKSVGCDRGSIPLSLFCKRHHFEKVYGRPCPFDN